MSVPALHHDESASEAGGAPPVRSRVRSRSRGCAATAPLSLRSTSPTECCWCWLRGRVGALRHLLGDGPNQPFPYAVDDNLRPVGLLSLVPDTHAALVDDYGEIVPPATGTGRSRLILGADGALGRDLFLRLLYGGQVSIRSVSSPR